MSNETTAIETTLSPVEDAHKKVCETADTLRGYWAIHKPLHITDSDTFDTYLNDYAEAIRAHERAELAQPAQTPIVAAVEMIESSIPAEVGPIAYEHVSHSITADASIEPGGVLDEPAPTLQLIEPPSVPFDSSIMDGSSRIVDTVEKGG